MPGLVYGECTSGCYSSHGGVKDCDAATNRCVCNNGWLSSCTCTPATSSGSGDSGGGLTTRDILSGIGIGVLVAGLLWGMGSYEINSWNIDFKMHRIDDYDQCAVLVSYAF